jgi:hypothetical protein
VWDNQKLIKTKSLQFEKETHELWKYTIKDLGVIILYVLRILFVKAYI